MDDEEWNNTVHIMETQPGPPAGRRRWYCSEREVGFDTPEEGVEWASPRYEIVLVRPLTGAYYWVNREPSEWNEVGAGPLRAWPPTAAERDAIDRNHEATGKRLAEAERLTPALLQEIARQLSPILPDEWTIEAFHDSIALRHGGNAHSNMPIWNGELEDVYRGVLDGVQSEVSEETTDAWPHDPARGMHMWEPETRLDRGALHTWYGPADDPAVRFEPIEIAGLQPLA